ncbi:MAG: hypothetical protein AB1758_19610 [Candidatus Eremiobacterota bacterium]
MLRGLLQTHIGTNSSDYQRGPTMNQKLAIAGGWTLLATGVGAAIGAARQARDVVTISQVPVPETVRVQVGTAWTPHCWIPMQTGDITTYMPSCYWDDPVYADQPTGRILGYRDVPNHSVGFPNTVLQGALLGMGIGVVTGAAGVVLSEVLKR